MQQARSCLLASVYGTPASTRVEGHMNPGGWSETTIETSDDNSA